MASYYFNTPFPPLQHKGGKPPYCRPGIFPTPTPLGQRKRTGIPVPFLKSWGLLFKIPFMKILPAYSARIAASGLSFMALMEGYRPESMETIAEKSTAPTLSQMGMTERIPMDARKNLFKIAPNP